MAPSLSRPSLLAILAFSWWGFVPIYWKHLKSIPAEELILYRIVLSALFLLPFWWKRKHLLPFFSLVQSPRLGLGLLASSLLIGYNWYLYVWAVNSGRVVEASLGYFINPLVNVALGTLLLRETMSRPQKVAIGFAFLGVLLLSWRNGSVPWVALVLAITFALYGLVRKLLHVPTIPGTFWETVVLTIPAGIALMSLFQTNGLATTQASAQELFVLLFCGFITTVPLLAFAEAAKGLPLSSIGFFQFISPSIQFLLGVFIYKEPFSLFHWFSFFFIWIGLVIFLLALPRKKRR